MRSKELKISAKTKRERQVLFGLIEHHLQTGKPVGSSTLQGESFQKLSSATIRNYFVDLEKQGYLKQLHTSGGRVPTEHAFRLFSEAHYEANALPAKEQEFYRDLFQIDSAEINRTLQKTCDTLSQKTRCAAFVMAPRFDQDFALDIKMLQLDHERALAVVITNFGKIRTETLQTKLPLNNFRIKRVESYFQWRLTGHNEPENLEKEELELAKQWFSEVMVRYIVDYSNFSDDEVYRTGLSELLHYPEIDSTEVLASSLSLFENVHGMRLLLKESYSTEKLKCWIGKDLSPYSKTTPDCSVICVPYFIHQKAVGAVGILGPMRIDYPKLFAQLRLFAQLLSETLTKSIYKYRITYRQPTEELEKLPYKELVKLEQLPSTDTYDNGIGN